MHIAIIGGASTIGTTVAYALSTYRQDFDITLVDPDIDAARGHATDLAHGRYHLSLAPYGTGSLGTIQVVHPENIGDISPDLAIITAGGPPPDPDDLDRNFRDTRIDPIVEMLDDIVDQLQSIGPLPVINVTNPLDRVTHYLWTKLGWERERIVGYSLSESARASDAVARAKGVNPDRVYCPTMGEHGEHMVIVFSQTTIDGEPATFDGSEKSEIREYVQDVPIRIANQRGLADSSRWVTSAGVLRLVQILDHGEVEQPLCLSFPLDGEYGLENGCLSIPVLLDRHGVRETIEWDLADDELAQLKEAHRSIVDTLP